MPIRADQTPDPKPASLPQPLKQAAGQFTQHIQVPSIAYAGGPFSIQVGCEGMAGAQLTDLGVRLEGDVATRGRRFLFENKVATEKKQVVVANWTGMNVALGQECRNLQAMMPQVVTLRFRSFTVALPEYKVAIEYEAMVRGGVAMGGVK